MEARFHGHYDLESSFGNEPTIRCASNFQCERCGEIWLNLTALGYECLSPGENMEQALKEYHDMTGFEPAKQSA